jgi:hypothetical protein
VTVHLTKWQHCGETLEENVRELTPGAAETWVVAMSDEDDGNQAGPSGSATQFDLPLPPSKAHVAPSKDAQRPRSPQTEAPILDKSGTPSAVAKGKRPDRREDFVLLCIPRARGGVKVFHHSLSGKYTDKEAFKSIKDKYDEKRNPWWRLTTLTRVKFKKVSYRNDLHLNGGRRD